MNNWFQAEDVPALFRAGRLIFDPSVPTGAACAAAYCLWLSRRAEGGSFGIDPDVMAYATGIAVEAVAKKLARAEEYKAIERVNPGELPAIYRFAAVVYDSAKGTSFWHVAREAAALAPRVTITPDPGPDCHAVAVLAWRLQRHSGDADVPISAAFAARSVGGSMAKSMTALKDLVARNVLVCTSNDYGPGQARRYRFVASVAVAG